MLRKTVQYGLLRPEKSTGVFPSRRMRKTIELKLVLRSSKKVLILAGMGLRDDYWD